MTRWIVAEENNCVHVLPETDTMPHGFPKENVAEISDLNCPCKPKVDFSGKKPMIVHNSFEQSKIIDEAMSNLLK